MRTWFAAAAAALLGLVFMISIRLPGMSDLAVLLMSNGGQLAAATAAAVGCAVAPRRTVRDRRNPRGGAFARHGGGAAGQGVWSYYEVVLDRQVPFPSLADVGFLLFPLVAAVGLVIWLG